MNKILVSLCMATALAGLSSCASSKHAASMTDINGEWNIIEINGSVVVPTPGQEFPYIGFNSQSGRVYGHSGCNRLMGSYDTNAKPGQLELQPMGTTRMMCPDMTVEQNILTALAQVKKVKKMEDGQIALCGKSTKRPILVLQRRIPKATVADLEGHWLIKKAMDLTIPEGMEKAPFIEFNTATKRLHGNAGCNLINGTYVTDDNNTSAISFPQVISTMMACPDSNVESTVLKALNAVKSIGHLDDGNIGLYDESGSLVLMLSKK